MDAQDWHRQAMQDPPPWPEPIDHEQRARATNRKEDDYLQRLNAALEGALVPSDEAKFATQQLDDVVQRNRLRPPGAMQMVAVSAPFTTGKSTLIKQWGQRVYREVLKAERQSARPSWSPQPGVTADLRPLIYVTLRAASTVKDVNAQLLMFLGYPPEGLSRTTTTRVLHALKMHKVQLIIIDDAHMLRTTNALGRQVLDYIKFLNTELGEQLGTVVLVGANLNNTTILDDPQIRGRLSVVTLHPYAIETNDQRRSWQRFLKTAEAPVLPYLGEQASGLFSRTLPELVWHRTQGFVGDTATLIRRAVLAAVTQRANTITAEDLDRIRLSERSVDGQLDLTARKGRVKRAS